MKFFSNSQPVFLKFHIKPEQGIVSGCDHNAESNKENFMSHVNANNFKRCSLCLKHFNAISDRLHTSLKSASFTSLPSPALNIALHGNEFTTAPLISINVFDPDNSNICMCNNTAMDNAKNSMNESLITVVEEDDDSTCRICQNMIEKSAEERRTVVFEKTEKTMFGDVIVNRIDSQYHLSSTYANNPSDIKKLQDPYTPESVESHSPLPEMDEKYFPVTDVDATEEIIEEIKETESTQKHESNHGDENLHIHPYQSNHIVNPRQLTTRLENLRRESQFMIGEGGKSGNGGDGENVVGNDGCKSSKKCFGCFCSIS